MISSPQADFIHAFHLGVEGNSYNNNNKSYSNIVSGEAFGDMSCLSKIEDADIDIQFTSKNSADPSIEQRSVGIEFIFPRMHSYLF